MFTILALSAALTAAPIDTDYLFILAHAGETNELIPVMEEMQKQHKDFQVLAMGVAKELITDKIDSSKQIDADAWKLNIEKTWPIDRELPQEIIESVTKDIHAKMVITGVAMLPQKQFLEAYGAKAKTVAFWDNPEPRGAILYFDVAHKVQAAAQKVLFPSGFVASAQEFASRPAEDKIVVGKPTLLYSLGALHQIDKSAVLRKIGFCAEQPVVAFIGTYGDRYEKAFQMFVRSLKTLHGQKPQVIFQIHPMANGDFEERLCRETLDTQQKFTISSRQIKNSTTMMEAIAIADLVVTYNSSAGFQALLGGKRVLYVVPEGDKYSNSLIESGMADRAASEEAIAFEYAKKNSDIPMPDLINLMEIPMNPKELFLRFFDEELHLERPRLLQSK